MTLTPNIVLLTSLAYVALLFGVAFWGDWRARRGRLGWLNSPLIYTLSISVYCTSWTFYGAVGSAARSGLEFATIYLGPTLVFIGWWAFLRRLVRVGRAQSVTSIADFLSSRYGKSPGLAAVATLVAVVVILPYIALQLKAVASSYHLITGGGAADNIQIHQTAFWLAAGLAGFTVLFGTRNLDSHERHHGVVAAIALEACVKLFALLAIGVFAVFGVAGGVGAVFQDASPDVLRAAEAFDARWAALTFLAATAVICLPRQFQVTVVECVDESQGRAASWAFPLYLFLISLFVLPIAIVGATTLPDGSDPDFYVLSLPLFFDESGLALLVFLGGFSSATSMVIVSCIALSTMVSNHLIAPVALRPPGTASGYRDVRRAMLHYRRVSIAGIMLLGYLYFQHTDDSTALASIGLISFAGAAQFLPAMIAALFWSRANARGALAGLIGGFGIWLLLLFAPSLSGDLAAASTRIAGIVFGDTLREGVGIFGMEAFDPLVHALFWSLSVNTALLIMFSLSRAATPMEQLQGALFADRTQVDGAVHRSARVNDLFALAQQILGVAPAQQLFEEERRRQNLASGQPMADDRLIARLERRLASSVGAASAHAMVSQLATGETISLTGLIEMADENARMLAYAQKLEQTSKELADTARQLREANDQLLVIDAEKDEFVSLVSHELRTPMTSLRSYSEILRSEQDLPPEKRREFLDVIRSESERLTRLLDQILDIGQLEHDGASLTKTDLDPEESIDRALAASGSDLSSRRIEIVRSRGGSGARIHADADRTQQVLMNVLSNSQKYNSNQSPKIWIQTRADPQWVDILIDDNGPGVPRAERERVFSRFTRAPETGSEPGVGLGLPICRQIMNAHGGAIELIDGVGGGACLRIRFPAATAARDGEAVDAASSK